MEAFVKDLEGKQEQAVSQLREQVQQGKRETQRLRDEIAMLRVQLTNDMKLVHAKMEANFQQTSGTVKKAEQAVKALREDMGQLRETMIVTAKEATELALAPIKATL